MSRLLDKLRSATRARAGNGADGKLAESGALSQALRRAQAERAALRAANEQMESVTTLAIEHEQVESRVEVALQAAIAEDRRAEATALMRADEDRRARIAMESRAEADRRAEDAALRRAQAERLAMEESSRREDAERDAGEAEAARLEGEIGENVMAEAASRAARKRILLAALAVIALAAAAAAAWNYAGAPRKAPYLKLDYGLDLNRTDASGQSSPRGPVPSR